MERNISLAAWNMVCKPKEKGGLGVLNMKNHNQALFFEIFGQVL
jgi:hypothetical protein